MVPGLEGDISRWFELPKKMFEIHGWLIYWKGGYTKLYKGDDDNYNEYMN